jgi:signal transduction histidine kinase
MATSVAALVVHDLKNELGALEGALERLALAPEPEAAREAHQQCRALREHLVMYLAVYGADGAMRAVPDDESPQDLLDALVAKRGQAPGAPTLLRLADAADLPPFWYFDRRLVAMALEAALHNALRFARSQVCLAARVEAGQLVLVVDDDGPGLDAEHSGGDFNTGLGTTLCQAVAQAHGGHVALFNRAEGGARFELWLAP